MPTFVHPALLAALGLVALPVLIHLINRLRHRRVEWAAMEFLLESQQKNRRWIILKELLLLLARMTAVAAVVLIVAQPVLRNQWGGFFGGGRTHHVVLLDDSYSMAERWSDTSALERAKEVIAQIATQAARQGTEQTFTLLRYSSIVAGGSEARPDLLEERVDTQFAVTLDTVLRRIEPSELAVRTAAALTAYEQMLPPPQDELRVLYLVSDYRAAEWDEPADLVELLARQSELGTRLELVDCVDATRPNFSIESLVPLPGTLAVGVPLQMEITVRNFSDQPAAGVTVQLLEDGHARPAVVFDQIAPRQSESRRFSVLFSSAGQHVVSAELPSDALATDNRRFAVVDVPAAVPVLIIDGEPETADAQFLSLALAPGGNVRTGLSPRIEPPSFLADEPLAGFGVIYLTGLDDPGDRAIAALESYVRAGGGVVAFVGERTNGPIVNERLYREGQGFFPLPLSAPAELLVDRLDPAPDMELAEPDHPLFRVFAGQRNSFLPAVKIGRYFAAGGAWQPSAESSTRVLAWLRNGSPLVVERKWDEGRVVAVLTTAAPRWNNWGRNPSFVVSMLELQSDLAQRPQSDSERPVGAPLTVRLDPARYEPRLRVARPSGEGRTVEPIDAVHTPEHIEAVVAETRQAGVYEVELLGTTGEVDVRRYAFNVDPAEGDLAKPDETEIAQRLEGVPHTMHRADSFRYLSADVAGFGLSTAVLYALIVLLVLEQLLAYFASYHPAPVSVPTRAGRVRG